MVVDNTLFDDVSVALPLFDAVSFNLGGLRPPTTTRSQSREESSKTTGESDPEIRKTLEEGNRLRLPIDFRSDFYTQVPALLSNTKRAEDVAEFGFQWLRLTQLPHNLHQHRIYDGNRHELDILQRD